MKKEEDKLLYEEILECISHGYDSESLIKTWIDEEITELFDKVLDKKEILSIEDKILILKNIMNRYPTFFSDRINIIYLKLLNLYERNKKVNGEDQELYYIVDRFTPSDKDLYNVAKTVKTMFKYVNWDAKMADYISMYVDIYSVLNKYIGAQNYAKNLLLSSNETIKKNIESLINSIEKCIKTYTSIDSYSGYDYATDLLITSNKYKYEEKIPKISIEEIASLYCMLYGSNLTLEEIILIKTELSLEQRDLLSNTIQKRKVKN